MDPELTALATASATALVTQMTTDAWTRIRDRFAQVLSREQGREEAAVVGELEQARDEVVAARGDEDEIAEARSEWQRRMRRALVANPEAADDLREILAELAPPEARQGDTYTITNHMRGGDGNSGVVMQVGVVKNLHQGQPPRHS
ncbi:hypothetical protein AB0J38_18515 [Streptomyces sp. NPDC050095]|uniref:hypothetical protein n=1 Tax=unclassified Streptomyces TaxID=2593676 RepID=UPI00344382AA